MNKLLLIFFFIISVLASFVVALTYLENIKAEHTRDMQIALLENYNLIFAPHQARHMVQQKKILEALESGHYCIAKKIVALNIVSSLDILDLKKTYDLSKPELDEIRKTAEKYLHFKDGNINYECATPSS